MIRLLTRTGITLLAVGVMMVVLISQSAAQKAPGAVVRPAKPALRDLMKTSRTMHAKKAVFPDDFRPAKDKNLRKTSDWDKYMMPSVWSEPAELRGGGGGFRVPIIVRDEAELRKILRKYIKINMSLGRGKTVRLDEINVDEQIAIYKNHFYFRITPKMPDGRTVLHSPFVVLRSSLLERCFVLPREWRKEIETDIIMGLEARKDMQRFQQACDLLFFAMFKYYAHGSELAPDAGEFLLAGNAGGGRVLKSGALVHRRVEDTGKTLRWTGAIGYKHTRLTRGWPPDDGKVHIPEPPAWFFKKYSRTTWHMARVTMNVDRQTGRLSIVRDRYPGSKGPFWSRQELTAGELMLAKRQRLIYLADAVAWKKRKLPNDFPPAKQLGPIRQKSGLLRSVSLLNTIFIDDLAEARAAVKTRFEATIKNFRHPTQRISEHKLLTAESTDVCHHFTFSYTSPFGVCRTTYVVLRPKAFERITGHPSTWMQRTSPPKRNPRLVRDPRLTSDVILTAAARTDRELFTKAVDLVVYLMFESRRDFLLTRSVDSARGKLCWTGTLAELPFGNQTPRSKDQWVFSKLLIVADPATGKLTFKKTNIVP